MSEYAQDESTPSRHNELLPHNDSLEDVANNSIIGKVKSRVSSILPNRLSKWFSPSAKLHNDSLNGSPCGANTTSTTRRRRRTEIEEESNEDDEVMQRSREYHGNSQYTYTEQGQNREVDNDEDDDSQNSDEEYNAINTTKQTRRNLNVVTQPPSKRSRLNIDERESPLISRHQPLLSSTPAVSSSYSRNSTSTTSASRSFQRNTLFNLYTNQSKVVSRQKESKLPTFKINTDIIELISNPSYECENKLTEPSNVYNNSPAGTSSRKSLNIPPSNSIRMGAEHVHATVSHLKRQPLSSAKAGLCGPLRRTSTTIQEVQGREEEENNIDHCDSKEKSKDTKRDGNAYNYNGLLEHSNSIADNKRQKLINGKDLDAAEMTESNVAILVDSASESSESTIDAIKPNSSFMPHNQHKTGISNMYTTGTSNTRNNSRTSSFGNGLNFYSHLEGRKSLFSGPNHGISNSLNNSSLSLTSLNRRQFNASIYGSTSALSDSRLLNTFSPFYKGKTTYGGAAAYNKYTASVSSVRITPTLIRPTSSLSTLSSNNSLINNVDSHTGDNSTISSTAKRILDLINDFATPLSEAKKMATSLNKANSNLQIQPQAKSRLNESDVSDSRAMRLSQVRTPYSRPAVILQPSGNASGRGTTLAFLPPIKELQVPTMSQLLQMKRMQNTTEKARRIAQNTVENTKTSEYTLPDATTTKTKNFMANAFENDQQKHTNKIKNKVTNSLRKSASAKTLQNEEPPPPLSLPNIAFPLMQSVPKIDIRLNKPSCSKNNTTDEVEALKLSALSKPASTEFINVEKSVSHKAADTFKFDVMPIKSLTQADCEPTQLPTTKSPTQIVISTSTFNTTNTFRFSEPLKVSSASAPTENVIKHDVDKYKFSLPLDVIASPSTTNILAKSHNSQSNQSQLKEGSCLDALSKHLTLPPLTTTKTNVIEHTVSGFGNKFKKSVNEWECDACMVNNRSEANKCIACETLRDGNSLTNQQEIKSSSLTATSAVSSSFDQKFKTSSNEWECDACMLRNKQLDTKCVACETPRKCAPPQSINSLALNKNLFGNAFKAKTGNWECQTCMISNKNEAIECIACQSKKSGGAPVTSKKTQCQFSFTAASATGITNSIADAGLKKLAAQQRATKWECDACMTRNDFHRTKCACCEQPRPGTSSEDNNSPSKKFQFGATTASKFTFGFGNGVNAPKEDDLRKIQVNKTEENLKLSSKLGIDCQPAKATQAGFELGVQPLSSVSDSNKDKTDASNKIMGFKFGVFPVASADKSKSSETVSTGLVFGSNPLSITTTAIITSPLSFSASIDTKPNLTLCCSSTSNSNTISNVDKLTCATSPTFDVDSSTTRFLFGSKTEAEQKTELLQENKALAPFTFKSPTTNLPTVSKSSSLVFSASTINNNLTATSTAIASPNDNTASSTPTPTTLTITSTVKPMFSFSSSTLTTPTETAFGSFCFESNIKNNAAKTTTANLLYTAVTSTSTVTTAANVTTIVSASSTTTSIPASTNIFGSFGGGGGLSTNTSATPIFGCSVNSPANSLTTVSSSTNITSSANTLQFGTFGPKTTSNVFGSSFGAVAVLGDNKSPLHKSKEIILPAFGNATPSSTSQSSLTKANASGFVFGANSTTTLPAGSITSTSTTWPKNNFVFGSAAAATSSSVNPTTLSKSIDNKEVTKPSVFGSFGSSFTNSTQQQQVSSIFGLPAPSTASNLSASGPANASTNLFVTNSAPAVTSIFGANSSGNAVTPAPAFASSPFGGAASTSATPTFGSTAASGATTFGGFCTTTNVTEVKKPEAAFSFGATPAAQGTSSMFNFGSSTSTAKPAFNFCGTTSTQQPTFNFTGATESQTSTKPFQFGATPSVPVFNFNRGVLEGTPNAPFQFNAGAAPVSSNIFAPTPTLGTQTAQQTKRKIRAPIRRVTQR